jgi:F1F0 ATPase subunit 2
MSNAEVLVLAGIAGVFLGAVFFGGLWWTVKQGVASQRAGVWFLGSLLIRAGISVAGFYFVSGGEWDRLLACLFGFTIARFIATWLSGRRIASGHSTAKESGHAP